MIETSTQSSSSFETDCSILNQLSCLNRFHTCRILKIYRGTVFDSLSLKQFSQILRGSFPMLRYLHIVHEQSTTVKTQWTLCDLLHLITLPGLFQLYLHTDTRLIPILDQFCLPKHISLRRLHFYCPNMDIVCALLCIAYPDIVKIVSYKKHSSNEPLLQRLLQDMENKPRKERHSAIQQSRTMKDLFMYLNMNNDTYACFST